MPVPPSCLPETPPPGVAQLLIQFDITTGQCSVNGCVDQKGMAYMMLALARDAIYDFNNGQSKSGLLVPRFR